MGAGSIFAIVGPVMVGPSSSHTAGAVRIGRLARDILGRVPLRVWIGLHGSFASTYRGHGTDLALAGGVLGMEPDDLDLRQSLQIARSRGIEVQFDLIDLGPQAHPNTARLKLSAADGLTVTVTGISTGGGNVEIIDINGFPLALKGDYETLLTVHQDRPGVIARVSTVLAQFGVNIAEMRVSRRAEGAEALMVVEVDASIPLQAREKLLEIDGLTMVRLLNGH